MTKQPFNTQADPRAKYQAMDGRFRIKVRGTCSLDELIRAADLKKQVVEEAAAMLDELYDEVVKLKQ